MYLANANTVKEKTMEKKRKTKYLTGAGLLLAFGVWTALVRLVDVRAIGPLGSRVGFAAWNGAVHRFVGVNFTLYTVTDWLGLVPIAVALGFAALGLLQWIRRRSLSRVDPDLLALGVLYVAVAAVYLFFEGVVINCRPVLIDGALEASYPSSTTLLALCVLFTAMIQFRHRIRNIPLRRCVLLLLAALAAFLWIGRFLSGVHWVTDIVGGTLFSAAAVTLYGASAKSE